MTDDLTLRLGAEAQQAIDTLKRVESSLSGIVGQVRGGSPIYDQFGQVATRVTTSVSKGTEEAAKKTSLLDTTIGKLTAGFTAANIIEKGISGVVRFGTEAFTSASRVLDLADATGLTTDFLQRLDFVEAKTSTTTGALSQAAYNLSLRWNDNRENIEKLGLSYEGLSKASPEEKFLTVTARLREMTDHEERNRLAVDLLGKTWKEVAPAVVADIEKVGAAAKITSRQTLETMSELQQSYHATLHNAKVTFQEVVGGFFGTVKQLASGAGSMSAQAALGLESYTDRMAAVRAESQKAMDAAAQANAEEAKYIAQLAAEAAARETYAEKLAKAKKQVAELSAETKKQILAAQELGVSEADLIKKYDLKTGALRILNDQTKAQEDATRKATERQRELRETTERIQRVTQGLTADQIAQVVAQLELTSSTRDIAFVLGIEEELVRRVAQAQKDGERALKEYAEAKREAAELELAINKQVEEQIKDQRQRDAAAQLEQARTRARIIGDQLIDIGRLEDEAADMTRRRTMSTVEYQKAQIADWARDQKAKIDQSIPGWEAGYAAIDAIVREKLNDLKRTQADYFTDLGSIITNFGTLAQSEAGRFIGNIGNCIGAVGNFRSSLANMTATGLSGFAQLINGMMPLFGALQSLTSAIGNALGIPGMRANDVRDDFMAGLGGRAFAEGLIGRYGNDSVLMQAWSQFITAGTAGLVTSSYGQFIERLGQLGYRPGGSAAAVTPAGGGGYLPPEGEGGEGGSETPHAAGGIHAWGRTYAVFGEGGEDELGGPVSFMSRVLRRAAGLDRAASMALAGGGGGWSMGGASLSVQVDARGAMFRDRESVRELADEVALAIGDKYRQLYPVGIS